MTNLFNFSELGAELPLQYFPQRMAVTNAEEEVEFRWGNKRGIGGRKKDVQFYKSFTLYGEKYALNDAVYLYDERVDETSIGKLIKIWENRDKSRKVKVQWFYRPSDILLYLKEFEARENELFLACGEGIGVADVNPLEAVAGKCNVVCISKDIWNPIPSDEARQMADFVYYRFFDVGRCKIVNEIDVKAAGILEEKEVEFKWGKKRGIGGRMMNVQFYESFTYNDKEYMLNDAVCLFYKSLAKHYIGKLIKIWENPDKSRKVKVQWFFRPNEIRAYLDGVERRDHELFFACEEGIGLPDVNPLEALAGKCNVICISKDVRNPLPSDEAIQMADFVHYRFFDVGRCKIVDEIDFKAAGILEEKEVEFKWGKKRRIGGRKKNLQVYESFTYNGKKYKLNDAVYIYCKSVAEPYIGKLIKIWENPDKSRKVEVQWFFRPNEIRAYLDGVETREKELFFACGEGKGLANVIPLGAVAGKCNVLCISKDIRNPQPSDIALQKADFVFFRFFDVGHHKILDDIDGKADEFEQDYVQLFKKLRL